ncbi:8159_t:CDS:2 [Diversispora eburnea]|uniref:8159_t:CDS:1 n=1 Tax=Diversispora eburnea TaxID=1213867 RepID=A0A9N8VGA9_9GLOM|nr:8159_t:CDS:2 [Diversispora eburnea]
MILNNLQSFLKTQDLYSSSLVNRIWCKVTISLLWELPFVQEYLVVQILAELISVQKLLENLSIVDKSSRDPPDYDSIFWAIIVKKETLKIRRLESLNFYHFKYFKWKSPSIGQFISLQKLYIEDCSELHRSDCLFLASSFTHLKFIVKILETANINLRNIRLQIHPTSSFVIFSVILSYCIKITNSTLLNLSSEQVIAIFNNNFNKLRIFSFGCGKGLEANRLLYQMAENVPESLKIIWEHLVMII